MQRNLPQRALIVAIATAQQESKLQNLNYGDADSVGLFQQRPSQGWGSRTQILDPAYAAGKFFDALLKVPNWQQLSVTKAASAVQRNAYPDAYKDWEPRATALTGALTGATSGQLSCRLAQPGVLAIASVSDPASSPAPADQLAASATAVTTGLQHDLDINHPAVVQLDAKRTTVTLSGLTDTASGDDTAAKHRTATVAAWAIAHSATAGITGVVVGDQEWRPDRAEWRSAEKPAPAGTVVVTIGLS
ncbi:MAG: heavy metal transporter, partial [Acidothermaceae bacterium]